MPLNSHITHRYFKSLEPATLAALPRVAKQGRELPERVNGKLAVRLAMGV